MHTDVPSVFPEGQVSSAEYKEYIKCCNNSFKTVQKYVTQNAFMYETWISFKKRCLNEFLAASVTGQLDV